MAENQVYVCNNAACTLGARVTPGLFTGGISAEQVNLITGAPVESLVKGKDYGPGICPNCGETAQKYDARAHADVETRAQIKALQATLSTKDDS